MPKDPKKRIKDELMRQARRGKLTKKEEAPHHTLVRGHSSADARATHQTKRENTFNGTDLDFV